MPSQFNPNVQRTDTTKVDTRDSMCTTLMKQFLANAEDFLEGMERADVQSVKCPLLLT